MTAAHLAHLANALGFNALEDLVAEVQRQDGGHAGYPATRDGVFLGVKTAVHELDVEAIGAWHNERCRCSTPGCTHPTWKETRKEIIQATAVLMRLVRTIDANTSETT